MTIAPTGWRADRDEHRLRLVHGGGKVGSERQPPGLDVGGDQLFQARLEDRHPALGEGGELSRVGLDHRDLGAELGEAGAGDEADIAAADHGYAHGQSPFRRCGGG